MGHRSSKRLEDRASTEIPFEATRSNNPSTNQK